MSFRSATLSPLALGKIKSFIRKDRRFEIGGPMVGHVSSTNVIYIEDVEGPGPRGICLPYNVTIDGQHSQRFCDEAHEKSNGKWDYIGDWHCHPGISMQPSSGDSEAIRLMAETSGLTASPVSLIYSRILRLYRIYEWDSRRQCLVFIPHAGS